MDKYEELVDLLEEVGVLQLQDEWAKQIQDLISSHRLADKETNQPRPTQAP